MRKTQTFDEWLKNNYRRPVYSCRFISLEIPSNGFFELEELVVIYNKLQKTQRPIIKHKHTQGEWRIINAAMTTCVESGDKSICTLTSGLSEINKHNAKLIRIAPQLLQIAEMYFDSMKGTDAEGSIPFNLTLETLNKLK